MSENDPFFIEDEFDAVERITKDLIDGLRTLSPSEARFLVDSYYTLQDYRTQSANQVRALSVSGEPVQVLDWLFRQMRTMEGQVKRALDAWTEGQATGRWMKSICGVGPCISAGLLAHINIEECPTVGHIWRFAGLDPTVAWVGREKAKEIVKAITPAEKKPVFTSEQVAALADLLHRKPDRLWASATRKKKDEEPLKAPTVDSLEAAIARRPWNADLKVLCFKIGDCFIKFSGNEKDAYGKVYLSRKAWESERNEQGLYAVQARDILTKKKIGKDTEAYRAYSVGKLPPGHLHARARRYAVKMFLSAVHTVMYWDRYGTLSPLPYPIAHLGHAHLIDPPNLHLIPELEKAWKDRMPGVPL